MVNGVVYKVVLVVFSEFGVDVLVINDEFNGCNIND